MDKDRVDYDEILFSEENLKRGLEKHEKLGSHPLYIWEIYGSKLEELQKNPSYYSAKAYQKVRDWFQENAEKIEIDGYWYN